MAVKIQSKPAAKTKAKAKSKISPKGLERLAEIANELTTNLKKLATAKKKASQLDGVVKDLNNEAIALAEPLLKNDEEYVFSGDTDSYTVSAKGKSTTITDNKKAFNLLEEAAGDSVWDLVGFKITDLRNYLTPEQLKEVTEDKQEGARRVSQSK